MHDLYKYDLYVSYFITFSLKKLFFGCLRKITFLGYGCDPDLGEPPRGFNAFILGSVSCVQKTVSKGEPLNSDVERLQLVVGG